MSWHTFKFMFRILPINFLIKLKWKLKEITALTLVGFNPEGNLSKIVICNCVRLQDWPISCEVLKSIDEFMGLANTCIEFFIRYIVILLGAKCSLDNVYNLNVFWLNWRALLQRKAVDTWVKFLHSHHHPWWILIIQ